MVQNNKIYITANEFTEMLGVSVGHAYKLIRKLNQDLEYDQMPLVEYIDPFTGEPVKKHKNKPLGAVVGNQSKPASPF